MQQNRQKITQAMIDQVSADYRRASGLFQKMQDALGEDLGDKLSKNIGQAFIEYTDDGERGNVFRLGTVESDVTKGKTFIRLYFVTDDIPNAKQRAFYISSKDINLLSMYRTGEISAKDLFKNLETEDFDIFVRRYCVILDLKEVVDIYNSEEAVVEFDDSEFKVHK